MEIKKSPLDHRDTRGDFDIQQIALFARAPYVDAAAGSLASKNSN
ncbi:MAG: hypothetical protein OXE51_04920 [Gammaproteobacteria bacterium]|nr:hypothetical protein [Gammaproteobacteria bacterium]